MARHCFITLYLPLVYFFRLLFFLSYLLCSKKMHFEFLKKLQNHKFRSDCCCSTATNGNIHNNVINLSCMYAIKALILIVAREKKEGKENTEII